MRFFPFPSVFWQFFWCIFRKTFQVFFEGIGRNFLNFCYNYCLFFSSFPTIFFLVIIYLQVSFSFHILLARFFIFFIFSSIFFWIFENVCTCFSNFSLNLIFHFLQGFFFIFHVFLYYFAIFFLLFLFFPPVF